MGECRHQQSDIAAEHRNENCRNDADTMDAVFLRFMTAQSNVPGAFLFLTFAQMNLARAYAKTTTETAVNRGNA